MSATQIGVIQSADFGLVGYQDCMLGVAFGFSWPGGGVCDTWAQWPNDVHSEMSESALSDRDKEWAKMNQRIAEVLQKAKKRTLKDLVGVPVELRFEGPGGGSPRLESWRVLEEAVL